ncbi:MAG: hypothetical protein PHG69_01590 [Candidatus Omnitrophica bacterium]|nr:hypothetical protein [Candidatus Omnitrophota bacterium]
MDVKSQAKTPNKGLMIVVPVLIILAAAAFVFAFSANNESQKYKKLFEKEMAFRLDMEEKVNQLRNEKIELTTAMDNKAIEIQEKDTKITELNKIIDSKDTVLKNLQIEIEKATSPAQNTTKQ